ncbi:phage/plasmid primase, P4 family [Actinomadura fulvescens]|uniref:DNA primase n=1 Tax=Actinomadura fulvescens TaxID=46160 RepID=A0ABP6C9Y3_9ACTN
MDFSRFLKRFAEVQTDPGGYLVPCPAHADGRPSLFLTLKDDGRLLIFCRAGCDRDAVLAALDLSPRDLFGWTPGEGVTTVKGGTSIPAPGPGEIAGLRVWLTHAAHRWDNPKYLNLVEMAEEYLRTRFGVDVPTMERLGLGLSPRDTRHGFPFLSPRFRSHPRLVVPLYDFDGIARGAQGRDLGGSCSARWVSLSNRRTKDDPDPVAWAKYGVLRGGADYGVYIVTEGPSDGLTVAAVGYDAVVVRGASIAANADLTRELADGMRGAAVVIAGDRDQAGEKFVATLGAALAEHGVTALRLTIPRAGEDLTDWRMRAPEVFPDALHEAVRAATPVAPPKEAQRAARARDLDRRTGTDSVSRADGDQAAELLAAMMERYGDTDTLRAHALVAFARGRIKYAPGLGYHVWNGRRWEVSETRVRQEVHRMGAALALAGKTNEAKGFLNTVRIDALMSELRAVPAVAVHASEFDARPELLSFRNGTVDLRTSELRDHDMRDMITRYVDQEYSATATAPRWERFLREIFPTNPELADYMRRLVGYGITGDTSEQAFAVLWGKGANGKSVLTDTLVHVFREISTTTPFQTFEEKTSGGIPNDLAALRGARLVMASEGESGKPMAEAILKRVTGTDMISARFLRKEFFEFKPSFLLMLATNHKPRFKGQDDGLWRRVKLVQFARYFAPTERDHSLTAALRSEAQGIIAWAVRGACEWYADGLQDPDVIREATREYRETSDPLAGFFPDTIAPDPHPEAAILGADAWNAYCDWCEAENLPGKERWTRRGFFSAMEERGAVRHKTNRGIVLRGMRLVSEDSANTPPTGGGNSPEGRRIFER